MAKSNRRRKQERAKRRAAAASREAAVLRRRVIDEAVAEARQRMELLRDPATPVDVVATLVEQVYAGGPVMPGLAEMLAESRGSVAEVARVAETLYAAQVSRPEGRSLTALTFAGHAAHLAGDHGRARELMDAALAGAEEPELRLRLASHLHAVGRDADALQIVAAHVADPAYAGVGADVHQATLEEAHRRLAQQEPDGDCPCGTGASWSACCRSREAASVEAFLDRSGLYALRTAVAEYLPRSAYQQPVTEHVAEFLQTAVPEPGWEPVDREPLVRLAMEHAWIVAGVDEQGEDDADNVLTALAADAATDPDVAAAALTWLAQVRYGLWQVAEPIPAPGLWCVDLVSGLELYVAFAPEQTEGLARWSVLLGALVPLDGAWRATGTLIRLSPSEADALVEVIRAGAEVIAAEIGGERVTRKAAQRLQRPAPFRAAPPHNVYAYLEEAAPPAFARLLSQVTGSLLPRLLAEVTAARTTPPGLTNTDGDPLTLIKARIRVRDDGLLLVRLAAHPDMQADLDDDSQLSWYGKQIPAAHQASMLAEAKAQLRAQGHADADITDRDRPSRWVRGTLRLRGNEITVEVNSQQRLEALLAILDHLGAAPTIVDQSRMDPTQDLPWPGQRPLGGGLAAPEQGWARQWLDEPVPALRGRTPRQTARSGDWPLLEGLLRQFEYDADILAEDGTPANDPAWLREQLDMPADRLT